MSDNNLPDNGGLRRGRGRFGGAQQGAITKGQYHEPKNRRQDPKLVVENGSGDFVVGIELDRMNNHLKVSKGTFAGLEGRYKYGIVVGNAIDYIATPDPPVDWATIALGSGFSHGDALPGGIPTGFGYVRLLPGSLNVRNKGWDADGSTWGSTETAADLPPYVVHSRITGTDNNQLELWFSHAVGTVISTYNDYIKVYSNETAQLQLTGLTVVSANRIRFTLSRNVNMDTEIITYKLSAGLIVPGVTNTYTNKSQGTQYVIYKRQKDCYVLVMNRMYGQALSVGQLVLISGDELMFDDTPAYRFVSDAVSLGGSGGTTFVPAYGTVYGGNVHPSSGTSPMDYVYPTVRPFIFALQPTEDPAVPNDWTDLELPETFEHGDPIPEVFPPGVGLVRLSRGSANVGTSAWDADIAEYGSDANDPLNSPTLVIAQIRNHNQIWLYWSEAVTYITPTSPDTDGDYVTLTASGGALTVTGHLSTGGNITKMSLSRDVDPGETITIALSNVSLPSTHGMVKDADNNENSLVPVDDNVIFSLARNCYAYVINRNSQRGFREGDMVQLLDQGYQLMDALDVNKSLRDIIPLNGQSALPHRHISEAPSEHGGGASFAHFLPTTWTGWAALGMDSLVRTTPDA